VFDGLVTAPREECDPGDDRGVFRPFGNEGRSGIAPTTAWSSVSLAPAPP